MQLKRWFLQKLERLAKGLTYKPITETSVMGKKYRVNCGAGTMKWNDYDDAWSLAIAMRSRIIFDVGSNIGQNALLNLYSPTVERIVLIDPNPEALAIAAENLIINNFSDKAIFLPVFASDKAGEEVKFWTQGNGSAGSIFPEHAVSASKSGDNYMVPTTTLDDICERYQLYPDYVKIDVEGAENMVLQGAANIARRQQAVFLVEMHSNASLSMMENAAGLLTWCRNNNYSAHHLAYKDELVNPEQVAARGRFHALLVPGKQPAPDYLLRIDQGAKLETVFA